MSNETKEVLRKMHEAQSNVQKNLSEFKLLGGKSYASDSVIDDNTKSILEIQVSGKKRKLVRNFIMVCSIDNIDIIFTEDKGWFNSYFVVAGKYKNIKPINDYLERINE